jgi:2-polyprenyl-3-methyl-5-hydroxy-6-metoxy-1,4-benzoquinol methylase
MNNQTPTQSSQSSPALFFDAVNSFQRSAAIRAGVDLDVFSIIATGKRTAGEIARQCNAAERGVRILCDYLVVNGFLTKQGNNYGLTPDSATFLDRKSPAYSGGIVEFLQSTEITSMFGKLTEAVRRGGTAQGQGGTVEAESPVWVKFARAMAPLMFPLSQQLAQVLNVASMPKLKVLDIAAGHGLYGIAIAQANPNAQVVALDWPSVVAVAKENAQKMGVGNRFQTIGGSAFDVDLGRDYDLILLPNFLHHFDAPTCETLLKRVHAALVPGGRAAALEFIPNEDRVSPPPSATFSLVMLASTPSGDAYTYPELDSMFRNSGFARTQFVPLDPLIERLVIAYK